MDLCHINACISRFAFIFKVFGVAVKANDCRDKISVFKTKSHLLADEEC